ncbi:hypothetical protein NQ318_002820 [Aromia moschata]|uniref:Uncharacterized protein n=1 Tax=Aromia moschata TaxID=1265417 RepID=A0AAV8X501_9CUCU|nr:hypothetical protein NQ318_002820 [Aromia moschata]
MMMKLILFVLLLTLFTLSSAARYYGCKYFRNFQPCNLPEKPFCECSGDVTAIRVDSDGTWCAKYSKGVLLKKWNCENRVEWESYLKLMKRANGVNAL